ncbi:TetR/AcrR family transcriptional regulator [Tsukamurella sp. PLM1]|uniref:TetR/AcrR family transcriptional regulator n=1 Tax=Tsukamurella sp. PLM1 TaxID=2929795 RepID=UPI002067983C|nr:TetR/AcrR family transcriptional regulator [Tsukamurella sp. PLM1]BDH59791.1 hypothetical protein MTP03_47300 [Tsukamurella sp. PLM1]
MTQARRKRPKDRREQIARVAAEDFSRRGYHGVGIEQIAATLDISGPAVYRHFPNKYALLEHAISTASDALCSAVRDAAEAAQDRPATERIDAILEAALQVSFERRNTGGLFRWEQRLLEKDDRARIRAQLNEMIGVFADAAEPAVPGVSRRSWSCAAWRPSASPAASPRTARCSPRSAPKRSSPTRAGQCSRWHPHRRPTNSRRLPSPNPTPGVRARCSTRRSS